VIQAFFSLYWFDKSLKISHEEKEVLLRLARVAAKKYETGQANQQDVLKAQLEVSKVMDFLSCFINSLTKLINYVKYIKLIE